MTPELVIARPRERPKQSRDHTKKETGTALRGPSAQANFVSTIAVRDATI